MSKVIGRKGHITPLVFGRYVKDNQSILDRDIYLSGRIGGIYGK